MSYSLLTKKFSSHLAEQFIESISEPANSVYYITACKHTPYDNGDVPTQPHDMIQETEAGFYDNLIFGKKITSSDVSHMAARRNWVSNTVYDVYSDDNENLYDSDFYVVCDAGSSYYIYKVLDNNNGSPSTIKPSSSSISESACNFITTSDGYMWKLMYKMSEEEFEKFATDDHMPVVQSANVAGNTVAGAIDVVRIDYAGSNYIATLSDTFGPADLRSTLPNGNTTTYRLASTASANTDFYVGSALYLTGGTGQGQLRRIINYAAATRVATIETAFDTAPESDTSYLVAPYVYINGDGTGGKGYAEIETSNNVSNYIKKIHIIDRGEGYTYASAVITGNTGGVSNAASLKVVMPPCGGHGFDTLNELGANYLGISVNYNTNESGYITTDNDYRKIAIIRDPLFNNVHMTMTDEYGTFVAGENIHQVKYITLPGSIVSNTTSATVTGTSTDFNVLTAGDTVFIIDGINKIYSLKTVSSITNATSIIVSSNGSIDLTSGGQIAKVDIIASGIKAGNTSPYITLDSAEPKFKTGYSIVGENSGAFANITAIEVNEKSFNNWNTFDNRTRISYTSSAGVIDEDDLVYQNTPEISNAYFHSANASFIFLTQDRGPINADTSTILTNEDMSGTYTLGAVKYDPDIRRGSGKVIYIENTDPISRSPSQSETIKVVLKF